MNHYIDILIPDSDLNTSLDKLGRQVGGLYAEGWMKNKRHLYSDKPFELNINAFAAMWFDGALKIFVVYDQETNEAVGFLAGAVFRPMAYKATVFQIQEWYIKPGIIAEQRLEEHVLNSIRILGCDELWIHSEVGRPLDMSHNPEWEHVGDFMGRRYVRR